MLLEGGLIARTVTEGNDNQGSVKIFHIIRASMFVPKRTVLPETHTLDIDGVVVFQDSGGVRETAP